MTMGIGYYNIMIRPLIKLVERYENLRNNNDEVNFLKSAVTKSINFWLQTEKKHPDKEKEILQKIALNQIWIKAKELDEILYKNIGTRLMRNNSKSIIIKDLGIMKFPNINYFLSNAPYHEIIDTAIIRESKESSKEKDIKFERILQKHYWNNIHSIKNQKELEATEIIKKLIINIPKLIKEKNENKIDVIEFQCLRNIHN